MLQRVHRGMLDALADLSPDPTWVIDGEGAPVACNAAFRRWRCAIEPETSLQLDELQRRALADPSRPNDLRVTIDGIERTFSIHARAVADDGAAFVAREVERHASEKSIELALMHLFASNDPLPVITTNALAYLCTAEHWDAAALWRVDGNTLRVDASWCAPESLRSSFEAHLRTHTFALDEETPGQAWSSGDVLWVDAQEDHADGFECIVAAPLLDGERTTGVLEFFSRASRPPNESARRMLAHTGTAMARLLERRQLLDQIANKGAEWLLTVDSIAMPILLVTNDARITRLNRTARQLTGRTYDDLIGRPMLSLGDGEPWTTLRDITAAVADGGMPVTAQIVAGETNWDVTASPLFAAGSGDDRIVIAMRDTTEIVRLQESVRRGEQLAALGELVAGVAHEVKNPLFGMSVTVDLLEDILKGQAESVELTAGLRKWIARLLSLTENLLAYGKTWSLEMSVGDLRDVLARSIESSELRAREAQVTIESELVSDTVLMDATRLELVFENLLANAIQHSSKGGRVYLRAAHETDGVAITVRDEGPGFRPGETARIFQPFYTRRRGGTGLGLSIVQRIVDEHGGTVAADNSDQGGAVLRVRLPIYRTGN